MLNLIKKIKALLNGKKQKITVLQIDNTISNGDSPVLCRLRKEGTSCYVTNRKQFVPLGKLSCSSIEKVFNFAYSLTFGREGGHRNHRSGGSTIRHFGQIFADTFQGKLAECAACDIFYKFDNAVTPDFSVTQLGEWDSVDIRVKNKNIAVKSTKFFGQLMLLESADWNSDGVYLPNKDKEISTYDYMILLRIKPSCEEILKQHRLLYSDEINKDYLKKLVFSEDWEYDCAGYITNDDLKCVISKNQKLRKGDLLNGKIPMDADNYYVQAGAMRSISQLNFND